MNMRKMHLAPRLLAALSMTLVSATATSATIYESADNRTAFQRTLGLSIQDARGIWITGTQFAALPFTLMQQSAVTGAELALTSYEYSVDRYTVQILGDNGGLPDSIPLWTASSEQPAPVDFATSQPFSFTSVSGDATVLEANTKYWLYLACSGQCGLTWWADPTTWGPYASQTNNAYPYNYTMRWYPNEYYTAMFRVTGSAVAVPEPDTWAMLLAGLGMVGVITRRRKLAEAETGER